MINSLEVVMTKEKMIAELLEIKITDELLQDVNSNMSPIDQHYDQLKCRLNPVERSEAVFEIIKDAVENNIVERNKNYYLKVENVL